MKICQQCREKEGIIHEITSPFLGGGYHFCSRFRGAVRVSEINSLAEFKMNEGEQLLISDNGHIIFLTKEEVDRIDKNRRMTWHDFIANITKMGSTNPTKAENQTSLEQTV